MSYATAEQLAGELRALFKKMDGRDPRAFGLTGIMDSLYVLVRDNLPTICATLSNAGAVEAALAECEALRRERVACNVGAYREVGSVGTIECRFCGIKTSHNNRDNPRHADTCPHMKAEQAIAAHDAARAAGEGRY